MLTRQEDNQVLGAGSDRQMRCIAYLIDLPSSCQCHHHYLHCGLHHRDHLSMQKNHPRYGPWFQHERPVVQYQQVMKSRKRQQEFSMDPWLRNGMKFYTRQQVLGAGSDQQLYSIFDGHTSFMSMSPSPPSLPTRLPRPLVNAEETPSIWSLVPTRAACCTISPSHEE